MEISLLSLLVLPAGVGLLGFIEPCTIGAHLVFLETQKPRSPASQRQALGVFIIVRALMSGLFGAGATLLAGFLQMAIFRLFLSLPLLLFVLFPRLGGDLARLGGCEEGFGTSEGSQRQ